jgi:DNA-directed RNA polymerase specialized sigma24 family protein
VSHSEDAIDHDSVSASSHGEHNDDRSSFAELVERYRPDLSMHCYRMLGSFDDVEGRVQQTFLRGWQHRGGYTERSAVRAWLDRIATNACLNFLSSQPPSAAINDARAEYWRHVGDVAITQSTRWPNARSTTSYLSSLIESRPEPSSICQSSLA